MRHSQKNSEVKISQFYMTAGSGVADGHYAKPPSQWQVFHNWCQREGHRADGEVRVP
jgi:hypothetical protein